MLGGSLDRIKNKCKCEIRTECVGIECQCDIYCKEYVELYILILTGIEEICWLTFSPKPNILMTDRNHLESMISLMKDMTKRKVVGNYILVTELTQKGQLHFHVFMSLKDKIKFMKRYVRHLYMIGNVLPIYGRPRDGIHYLFKSQGDMAKFWGISMVITNYNVDDVLLILNDVMFDSTDSSVSD